MQATSPRMPVTVLGVSGASMPVSVTTTTSQSRRSRRSASRSSKFGEPDSSSPSIRNFRVTGGRVAAGGGQVGAEAKQVEQQLALVVGCAASPQQVTVDRRDERLGVPRLDRVDRLDVVVAVDERRSGRLRRRSATRRRPPAGPAWARSRRSGIRCGGRRRRTTRHFAATSAWCSGWALMPGMRSHWSRSASRSCAVIVDEAPFVGHGCDVSAPDGWRSRVVGHDAALTGCRRSARAGRRRRAGPPVATVSSLRT